MTTSSTSCSTSQSARPRRSAGVVPTFWRSKWKSPSISTSATATASIFLWTSIPAIRYGIGLSLWERRACLVASLRVASYRRSRGTRTTLNYSVNHARSGSNSCSASLAPWLISISPLPAPPFCPIARFSFSFAGLRPSRNQLRKSSSAARPLCRLFAPRRMMRAEGVVLDPRAPGTAHPSRIPSLRGLVHHAAAYTGSAWPQRAGQQGPRARSDRGTLGGLSQSRF